VSRPGWWRRLSALVRGSGATDIDHSLDGAMMAVVGVRDNASMVGVRPPCCDRTDLSSPFGQVARQSRPVRLGLCHLTGLGTSRDRLRGAADPVPDGPGLLALGVAAGPPIGSPPVAAVGLRDARPMASAAGRANQGGVGSRRGPAACSPRSFSSAEAAPRAALRVRPGAGVAESVPEVSSQAGGRVSCR
jgi:hypothetical protein